MRPEASGSIVAVRSCILVLNAGSSSIKFALFSANEPLCRHLSGAVDGIGRAQGRFRARDEAGRVQADEAVSVADHEQALKLVLSMIELPEARRSLIAVGHRIVHGGPGCDCPEPVTSELERRLGALIPLAPLHLPHNLAGIAAVRARRPHLPQVACFDTAFHRTMPKLARMTPLPRNVAGDEIQRYGFHGLSYEFVLDDLRRAHGKVIDSQRLIVAHLGNGASMAAIRNGRSIDTTMGFSTVAGLPMGTRSGDLDPGIILHLIAAKAMSVDAVQHLLYERSGLLGISGLSSDIQELLGQMHRPEVVEAIDYFCARARAYVGSLSAALGGVDRLIFTGGIGANAPLIRQRICEGLRFLGIDLDPARNQSGERMISRHGSPVVVEALPTDEELMIARHTLALMAQRAIA